MSSKLISKGRKVANQQATSRNASEKRNDVELEPGDLGRQEDPVPINQPRGLRGKNGHRWCTVATSRKRVGKRNIVHVVQGLVGDAREADSPLKAFGWYKMYTSGVSLF
jgi:hypothetical protein